MKLRVSLFAALLPLLVACSDDSFPVEFDSKPLRRIDPEKNEYYGPAEPTLETLLLSKKKNGATNHFCVVGYQYSQKNTNVWVHWEEEQRLLLWRSSSDPEQRAQGLVLSKDNLKLGEDTVETAEEIGTSTYLVTRAWWQAIATDCAQHGRRYTVEPFTASGSSSSGPSSNGNSASRNFFRELFRRLL